MSPPGPRLPASLDALRKGSRFQQNGAWWLPFCTGGSRQTELTGGHLVSGSYQGMNRITARTMAATAFVQQHAHKRPCVKVPIEASQMEKHMLQITSKLPVSDAGDPSKQWRRR